MWFSFSNYFAADLISSPIASTLLLIFGRVMCSFADLQNLWTCLSLACLVLFPLVPAVTICWGLGHWSYLPVQCNFCFLGNLGFPLSASLHLLHSRMELHWHAANWRIFILWAPYSLLDLWKVDLAMQNSSFFFFSTWPGFCEDFEVLEVSRLWKWTAVSNLLAFPSSTF